MGVDIELESIFKHVDVDRVIDELEAEDGFDIRKHGNEIYRRMEMSGGFFRNAYNEPDVFWALGLSWEMVRPMLDADHRLPIAEAKELLALLEQRAPNKQAYIHLLDHHTHPTTKMFADLGVCNVYRGGFHYDALFDHVVRKYRTLLSLLRKSIALGEPLNCSL